MLGHDGQDRLSPAKRAGFGGHAGKHGKPARASGRGSVGTYANTHGLGPVVIHPPDCIAVDRGRAFFDALTAGEAAGDLDAYANAIAEARKLPGCDCYAVFAAVDSNPAADYTTTPSNHSPVANSPTAPDSHA